MQFDTLPGFRVFYPEACAKRNHIFNIWRRTARAFSFLEYDTPVLEPLELYVEKSGEEIVGQLFNFEDRGKRAVALRPEATPSLARLVAAKANSLKRPVKWFSIGEQYRYERPQKGRLRAFYQFNADILGEPGPAADAELVSLCVQALCAFGLTGKDFRIRLSDRDLWLFILESEGLEPAAINQVLIVIDKLERMPREKIVEQLTAVVGDNAGTFLERLEKVASVRTFDALESLIRDLPVEGDLAARVERRLGDWTKLLRLIKAAGAEPFVQIDLGIVRGLAYYTGFVFEAFEASGESRALAGGGRYDNLVKKLGGPDMPAVGFAMGDVTLADLLDAKGLLSNYVAQTDFVAIIGGEEACAAAMADAAALRSAGYQVEYPLKDQTFGKQFKQAAQSGARFGLIYGSDELAKGVVKIRDFSSGAERELAREQLVVAAGDILAQGLE